jgi:hypothetical protein
MSNLSELLPTGGGQNSVEFVASGTLSSGQTVALKTDGTVEAVAESSVAESVGSSVVFETSATRDTSVVYDANAEKIVVAYRDTGNSDYGTAVVGTVSGSSISFGTPVVFKSNNCQFNSIVYSTTAQKVVVVYRTPTIGGRAIVGTVSGTSISFGSDTQFASDTVDYTNAVYDSTNDKIVVVYQNASASDYGYYIVGTVSGTSISFGTQAAFNSVFSSYLGATYDSTSGAVVVAYGDFTNDQCKVIAGTVSGTSMTWGSELAHDTVGPAYVNSLAHDPEQNKTFLAYRRGTTVYGKVLTVSGTTVTAGTADSLLSTSNDFQSVSYHVASQKMVYSTQQSNNEGRFIVCTISGTTFSKSSTIFFANTAQYISSAYDSNNSKIVVAYRDTGNSNYGTALTFNPAYFVTNSADFIGITAGAISDTATGAVNVYGGINEAQTGLTIGSDYYVQANGSLSTATSTVKAGQAISATTINMMDLT